MNKTDIKGIVVEKVPNMAIRKYHTEIKLADVDRKIVIWCNSSKVTNRNFYRAQVEMIGGIAEQLFWAHFIGQIIISSNSVSVELLQDWMLPPMDVRPSTNPKPLYSFKEVETEILGLLKNEFRNPETVKVSYREWN